jgi:hypothetical protein
MGLDQYAYVAAKAITDERTFAEQREIAYWRKHPNLQGWMEQLWRSRNTDPSADPAFNGVELELTWADLDQLEKDIKDGQLPYTQGFFFGEPSDDYYKQQDLDFIKNARADLFIGLKVFYNSSW